MQASSQVPQSQQFILCQSRGGKHETSFLNTSNAIAVPLLLPTTQEEKCSVERRMLICAVLAHKDVSQKASSGRAACLLLRWNYSHSLYLSR
mmetsp:Transcript_5976/g.37065  ORF Transcript_5976/g.37065 Transcript_5976/m.37065 type:complete len:92 (+) Transcript_5976:232-507(+)